MTWEDLSDLEAEAKALTGPTGKCGIRLMLIGLDDDARDKVEALIANHNFSNSAVSAVLRKRVGDSAPRQFTVARHRRGDCSCR